MLRKGNLVKTNILFFPLYILRKNIRFGLGWLPLPPSFFHEINRFQVHGDVEISYIGFGDDSKKILISISLFIYYL